MIQQLLLFTCMVINGVYAFNEPLTVYKVLESKQCTLAFVEDSTHAKYVVKQRKGVHPKGHFRVVCEALASYVAQTVGIQAHHAIIIKPGRVLPGKFQDAYPAVMLTHAPGILMSRIKGQYSNLDIKYYWHEYYTGNHSIGFSNKLIFHMSRHKGLPAIVALDLFIGNPDRNANNYFYDQATDSFCCIDMEAAFHKNLCKGAIMQLKELLASNQKLTKQEVKGLRRFKKIFKRLITAFPPDVLYNKYLDYAFEAGFEPLSFLYTSQIKDRRIQRGKELIYQTYQDALEVLAITKKIIKKHLSESV